MLQIHSMKGELIRDTAYSLSDIASVMNDGAGFGGNSAWLIILFVLIFGWGGFNRGQGEFGQYATAASQNEILSGQKFDALSRQINQVGDGLCSSTYSLNNSIQNEGRNLQMQLAECCCGNKEATAQVRYDMANFAAQLNSNIDNKFAALEKSQLEQTIASQQSQINALNLAQQLSGVVRYPMATTYNSGSNPFCSCGCGCGTI